MKPKKRRNKYGNTLVQYGEKTFHSKKERNRYIDLLLLQKAGQIESLACQVPFDLEVNGTQIGQYVADFVYYENGQEVVEDVKGVRTPLYKWKRKHFAAHYGKEIRET